MKKELTAEEKAKKKSMYEQMPDFGQKIKIPALVDTYDDERDMEYKIIENFLREYLNLDDVDENNVPVIFNRAKSDAKVHAKVNIAISKVAGKVGLKELLVYMNDMWFDNSDIKDVLDITNIFAIYKELRSSTHE